jgi:hypothetical protein
MNLVGGKSVVTPRKAKGAEVLLEADLEFHDTRGLWERHSVVAMKRDADTTGYE